MALKPNEGETFLREVDEELRKERVSDFVARYGWALVAGLVLLLAAIGGWIWWQARQEKAAAAQGETLLNALDSMESGSRAAAAPKIAELAESDIAGYRAAALFARANSEIEQGNAAAAIATLRGIAANEAFDEPYRQAALIRQTGIEFDRLTPQAVIGRLRPLARPGGPWFGAAGEMIAIAHLRMRRPDLAGPLFGQIARDETVPASIRTRAVQMAGSLGINAIDDQVAPGGRPAGPGDPDPAREKAE